MHGGEPVLHREVSESCSVEKKQRICQHEDRFYALLAIVNIRNAWGLTLTMVRHPRDD